MIFVPQKFGAMWTQIYIYYNKSQLNALYFSIITAIMDFVNRPEF
jgi:hypothetical protein